MIRRIILSIVLFLLLFTVGMVTATLSVFRSGSDLRSLVEQHEIRQLRQDLRLQLEKTQEALYAHDTIFEPDLDEVVSVVRDLNRDVELCLGCHHSEPVSMRIDETTRLVHDYQQAYSEFITTPDRSSRRAELQIATSRLGEDVRDRLDGMTSDASSLLKARTVKVMDRIEMSKKFVAVFLPLTFVLALLVSRYLVVGVTRPVETLLLATERIADGELGYRADHREQGEFGRLLDSFNGMSQSLRDNESRIGSFIRRLHELNTAVIAIHSATSNEEVTMRVMKAARGLIQADIHGFAVKGPADDGVVELYRGGETHSPSSRSTADWTRLAAIHDRRRGANVLINQASEADWPFGDGSDFPVRNLAIAWIEKMGTVVGALLVANKPREDILVEDMHLLQILARNAAVAMDGLNLNEDLRRQMDQLRRTEQQLIEAEKLTAIGTLTGGIAHDFNNILCGMIGQLQLMKHVPLSPDIRKRLNTAEAAARRAAELTRRLLTFSRSHPHDEQLVDVNDRIRSVVDLMSNTMDKQIDIELDLGTSEALAFGDGSQLEQVILNLVVNARDSMNEGGRIRISTEIVEDESSDIELVGPRRAERWIRLCVEDEGVGMSEDVLCRIFDPFFTTKQAGTGLGLSVLKKIVESHGGACRVQSRVGDGTRFEVYLPKSERRRQAARETAQTRHTAGKVLLVVDDEEAILDFMSSALKMHGYTIHRATNGQRAVELSAQHQSELDLVLLDFDMPVMNGRDAYRELRRICPDTKIVLTTGWPVSGDELSEIAETMDGLLQKPFGVETLSAKVAEVLASSTPAGRCSATTGRRRS